MKWIFQICFVFTRFTKNYVLTHSDYTVKYSQSTGSNAIVLGMIGNSFITILINRRLIFRTISKTNSNLVHKLQCKTSSKNNRCKVTSKKKCRTISRTNSDHYSKLNNRIIGLGPKVKVPNMIGRGKQGRTS